MPTRRDFLGFSLASLSSFALGRFSLSSLAHQSLGVQLYTLRDQVEADLPGVLAQVRQIGYEKVEFYWNVYTHPAPELRRMIADHGLAAPSGHLDYDGLPDKLEYARELGLEYVVCPMLPKEQWSSLDGYKRAAEQFNRWGERARSMGMRFAFHNHNYEFRRVGNSTGFDVLMEHTDPKLIDLEMDCYWITQAGRDPVQMLRKHAARIRMLHLKDRKPGFPPSQELNDAAGHFTEVGNGTIQWKEILVAAQQQGVRHLFVEQDLCDRPPIESIRISYRNLQALL